MLRWLSKIAGVGASGWCVLMSLYMAIALTGQGMQVTHLADGAQIHEEYTTRLLQTDPVSGSIALTVATLLGVLWGWAAWTGRTGLLRMAAGFLLTGAILASLSIGLLYLPAAGALILAAALTTLARWKTS
jgi:hypothetical protein